MFEGYAIGYEHLTVKKVQFREYYPVSEMHSGYKFIQNLIHKPKKKQLGANVRKIFTWIVVMQ